MTLIDLSYGRIRANKRIVTTLQKMKFFGSTGLTEFVTAKDRPFIFETEEDAVRSFV